MGSQSVFRTATVQLQAWTQSSVEDSQSKHFTTGQMQADDCGVSKKSRHTMTGHVMLREIKLIKSFYLKTGNYSLSLMWSSGAEMPFCCSNIILYADRMGLTNDAREAWSSPLFLWLSTDAKACSNDLIWTEENYGAWLWPESKLASYKLISLININNHCFELWLHKG